MDEMTRKRLVEVACGREAADLVLKDAAVLNVFTKEIQRCDIAVADGWIAGLGEYDGAKETVDLKGAVVTPGLIDAHIHIESTMVLPGSLAKVVVPKGTTTLIADPHEIANVLGEKGIRYLLDEIPYSGMDIRVMAPSCVPCTAFEHSGAAITPQEIRALCEEPNVLGLGEMMNYVGVTAGDPTVLEKLAAVGCRPIDGHAPGLSGKGLQAYRAAGVCTDHECTSFEEALEKLRTGMYILVRQGSTARDLEQILPEVIRRKVPTHRMMFCTDDKKISDILEEGHIECLVRRAIALGMSPEDAVCMATINPAQCYGLTDVGAVAPGRRANFVVLKDLTAFQIADVYYQGRSMAAGVSHRVTQAPAWAKRTVNPAPLCPRQLAMDWSRPQMAIGVTKDSLYTKKIHLSPEEIAAKWQQGELCKLAVIERHKGTGNVGVCLLSGYGLRRGAIATTVGHDSHNIIVAGCSDEDMLAAVEELCRVQGGFTAVLDGAALCTLQLPIAGLMSEQPGMEVARTLEQLKKEAHRLGVLPEIEPFISLAFLALPVIPELKLTDMGLFDVGTFQFVSPEGEEDPK